ncbi:MAG: carbon-nitrogen hydrolase family protein [Bryobacterales bacterium]|nr:carbon-nitrogen hydrolase family protein [Bryobacterales bacterium]
MKPTVYLLLLIAAGSGHSWAEDRNRVVRVVSVSQADLNRSAPDFLEETMERLERASSFRPDIAALPELAINGAPETVLEPAIARLSEWAKRNSSYVVFGARTRVDGRLFNSAILLDRSGAVAGKYNKIHPTENELKSGIHPGQNDPPVFETDFGIVGIQICFDVNWWDSWRRLKQKGAKIVFFPSAYPAARQIAAIALENQFFVVASAQSGGSRIYDIVGDTMAASGRFQPYAAAVLPVGKRLFEIDFNNAKARAILNKYGPKVEVTWHHDDDWFTLASLTPELTVDGLIAEFGLTPLDEYRMRAAKAIDEVLEGASKNR